MSHLELMIVQDGCGTFPWVFNVANERKYINGENEGREKMEATLPIVCR